MRQRSQNLHCFKLFQRESGALEIVWTGMPTVLSGHMKARVETTLRGASFTA